MKYLTKFLMVLGDSVANIGLSIMDLGIGTCSTDEEFDRHFGKFMPTETYQPMEDIVYIQ